MNLYDSIIDAVEEYDLSAQERGQLSTAVIEYLYFGREPDFKMTKAAGVCYVAMHPVFESQRAKQEAGRIGGKAKANAKQTASKTLAEGLANAKQNDSKPPSKRLANSNSNSKEKKEHPSGCSKEARFSKPSREEVAAYAAEIGHPFFNASQFCDYYDSNGWKVGRNSMKDWKATVRRWEQKDKPEEKPADELSAYTGRSFADWLAERGGDA